MFQKKNEENITEEVIKQNNINPEVLKQIIDDSFQTEHGLGDTAKDLETAKIILSILLDKNNIASTTNLSSEHIEDISDAEMLDEIFDNPLLQTKIDSFRTHRRSLTDKPNNLLQILSDIVGRSTTMENKSGILETMGKRFK
jgi:hypothetical protein